MIREDGISVFADTYTVLGKLGEGSGGVVYKAYHKRLKKEVVIKKLRKKCGYADEPSGSRYFEESESYVFAAGP